MAQECRNHEGNANKIHFYFLDVLFVSIGNHHKSVTHRLGLRHRASSDHRHRRVGLLLLGRVGICSWLDIQC